MKEYTEDELDAIIADRKAFSDLVYTPPEEALAIMGERKKNETSAHISDLPEPLVSQTKAILFRQLITPNHEVLRFLSAADALNLEPLFFEYLDDKFTSNNDWKYFLGRNAYFKGRNSKGESMIDCLSIIDFAKYDGKKIREVDTLWGESLVNFHHQLLSKRFPDSSGVLYDASHWLSNNGGEAKKYYLNFLKFFISNAILFENFLLDEREKKFNREIFLPSYLEVWKSTGQKPLIVALEPTDIEGDDFWMYHPYDMKEYAQQKLRSLKKESVGKNHTQR